MEYHETTRQFIDLSDIDFAGRVLDIGGGGEGIISRHSGDKVVAIDVNADELAETPDIGVKIIMDACRLAFLDGYFDHITCFYSLMYMNARQIEQFLDEAFRVLKRGGLLWIWDAAIPATKSADIFVVQLEVKISNQQTISVGYGVPWDREQSLEIIKGLCERARFSLMNSSGNNAAFALRLQKE